MRHAFLIAPLFIFGCTPVEHPLNAQYSGRPLTAVFTDLGPPDGANTLEGGQTEYIWRAAASEEGVDNCVTRILTDGGGTVVSADKSDEVGFC